MNKKLLFILLATLALAACQNDKAPAAKAPAEPVAVAVSPDVTVAESKKAPLPAEQKPAVVPSGNAVAVTKPAKTNIGQSMQAALQQAGAEVKAKAVAIQSQTAMADKPAEAKALAAKQLTAESAAVKKAVAKKVVPAAVKAAPAAKPVIAPKAVAVDKPAAMAAPKVALATAPVMAAVQAAKTGDAARGKSLARKCKVCHNFTAKKKVGPGLKSVFARKAGIMPDMKYSPALTAGGWVWNEKNLALWVCDSKKAVKTLSGNAGAKTKMSTQRICDAGKQADLIAFLKTL